MGSGGHAKEVLEVLLQNRYSKPIAFFNNVSPLEQIPNLFKHYTIIRQTESLKEWFLKQSPDFVLGIGGIEKRKMLWELALSCGGEPVNLIANNSSIGSVDVNTNPGLNVMQFVFVSNSVSIGKSALLNTRCNIHHDVEIGDFCEIGPGALLLGNCKIGNHSFIGAGAIILPGISIGNDCTIGAGAVVTKNIEKNLTVKGNPGRF